MLGIIIAIVLALLAAGGGTAFASQTSLPGDTLYPVKLGTEQLRMMLPGEDIVKVERALIFADRRVQEMVALAEKERVGHLVLAVDRYEDAIRELPGRMERTRDGELDGGNIAATVGNVTANHLAVLDGVYDRLPDEARAAVARAREASLTGQQNALAALARHNPVDAAEMNLDAMRGRLNRARAMAAQGNGEEVDNALGQFEAMVMFGEEVLRIAQQAEIDVMNLEELMAKAIPGHLPILDEVDDHAPDRAKPAIARARWVSMYRFGTCLLALAREHPAEAIHINLAAMGERLNRVRTSTADVEAVNDALEQFEGMAQFGEAIAQIAQEVNGDEEEMEALVAGATVTHLEVLAEVWEAVPEEARTAVEDAMARALIRHQERLQAMEQRGVDSPRPPVIPPMIRERVDERVRELRIWMEREGMLGGAVPPGWSCAGCRR